MKRPATRIVTAAFAAGALLIVLSAVRVASRRAGPGVDDGVPCGEGFARQGTRCCPTPVRPAQSSAVAAQLCAVGAPPSCPSPLVATADGCDEAERDVVLVPQTRVRIGPSDWEAEGRVRPRIVETAAFAIDRFEVSAGRARALTPSPELRARLASIDAGRAASGITRDEARAVCRARGGRLPTEDEWIVAAAGDKPRRYPWGDTGAVCRRAAWGLLRGPCGSGAIGPDTVGAHVDGASPLGVHDLAGNVAEWVETADGAGVVRGGSFETDLATDLRTWVRREVRVDATEPSIGFRCAYEPVESGAP